MIKQLTKLLAICIVVAAAAFYGGYRYRGQVNAVPVDNTEKLDSIKNIANTLEDSIRILKTDKKSAAKTTVIYRTKYDTIRPKEDLTELLLGLTQIVNTPPR